MTTPTTLPMLPPAVLQVLTRDHAALAPVVTECNQHARVKLVERPIDCPLCSYDLRAALSAALRTNEWLDRWRTDMIVALEDS